MCTGTTCMPVQWPPVRLFSRWVGRASECSGPGLYPWPAGSATFDQIVSFTLQCAPRMFSDALGHSVSHCAWCNRQAPPTHEFRSLVLWEPLSCIFCGYVAGVWEALNYLSLCASHFNNHELKSSHFCWPFSLKLAFFSLKTDICVQVRDKFHILLLLWIKKVL